MERQRLQEALTELNALPIPFTGGPK
jgi:hypothetical protein